MELVIIESPFSGDINRNIEYARMAIRDSLKRGESPIASHLLYTQDGILKDEIPQERELGINAGWEWYKVANKCCVYEDFGLSNGMKGGINFAEKLGVKIEYRKILK